MPNDLHKMRVEIAVETRDGSRYSSVCRGPRGTWGLPRLERKDHRVKLEDCLSRSLAPRAVTQVLNQLDRLDRLSVADVCGIVRAIGRKRINNQQYREIRR